jgi:hypothetical protein
LLFSLVLLLHSLNFLLLIFELPLLRRDLGLGLSLLVLSILHLITHCETAQRSDTAADCGSRAWCADRSADNRAGCGSDTGADKRALLTRGERFSGASDNRHDRDRHQQTLKNRRRYCPHESSSFQQFSCPSGGRWKIEPTEGHFIIQQLSFVLKFRPDQPFRAFSAGCNFYRFLISKSNVKQKTCIHL